MLMEILLEKAMLSKLLRELTWYVYEWINEEWRREKNENVNENENENERGVWLMN